MNQEKIVWVEKCILFNRNTPSHKERYSERLSSGFPQQCLPVALRKVRCQGNPPIRCRVASFIGQQRFIWLGKRELNFDIKNKDKLTKRKGKTSLKMNFVCLYPRISVRVDACSVVTVPHCASRSIICNCKDLIFNCAKAQEKMNIEIEIVWEGNF